MTSKRARTRRPSRIPPRRLAPVANPVGAAEDGNAVRWSAPLPSLIPCRRCPRWPRPPLPPACRTGAVTTASPRCRFDLGPDERSEPPLAASLRRSRRVLRIPVLARVWTFTPLLRIRTALPRAPRAARASPKCRRYTPQDRKKRPADGRLVTRQNCLIRVACDGGVGCVTGAHTRRSVTVAIQLTTPASSPAESPVGARARIERRLAQFGCKGGSAGVPGYWRSALSTEIFGWVSD